MLYTIHTNNVTLKHYAHGVPLKESTIIRICWEMESTLIIPRMTASA